MHELLSRVLEELRYAWRFRWYGMLVAWAVCLVGWLLVYSLPNVYHVSSRVRIDTTSVIQPLVKDLTVSPSSKYKVNLLIHTVLSKPNLKEVARRTGLDIKAKSSAAEQALIARLGHDIKIRTKRGSINLYGISYSNSNAQTAHDVVQEVINIMTNMALGNGVHQSKRAIEFLQGKVKDYRSRLYDTEKKLTAFKKAHPELMHGPQGYLAELQTTRAVLEQMKNKLKTLQKKRDSLQEKLKTTAGSSVPVPPAQNPEVQSLNRRIEKYEDQLTQLLTHYTPEHPDVIRHKSIIKRLKGKKTDLLAQLQKHPSTVAGSSTPGYKQMQQRLDDIRIEIETLQSSISQKQLQTNVLDSNSGEATEASAKLADLSRDYDSTKKQYETLLSRLNSARLSRDIDTFGDPLRFNIIDPPEVPDTASGPPRQLFMLVVLLAGLGAGGAFAFFLAQIWPVFMSRRKLTEVTGFPVLGSVTMAWSGTQRTRHRAKLAVFAVLVGGLVVAYVAAVALIPVGIRVIPAILGQQFL